MRMEDMACMAGGVQQHSGSQLSHPAGPLMLGQATRCASLPAQAGTLPGGGWPMAPSMTA